MTAWAQCFFQQFPVQANCIDDSSKEIRLDLLIQNLFSSVRSKRGILSLLPILLEDFFERRDLDPLVPIMPLCEDPFV